MAITAGVGPAQGLADGDTSWTCTLTGTTAGRTLVIGCFWGSSSVTWSTCAITSESNATIHAATLATNAGISSRSQLATLSNITTGGDKTITVTMSGSIGASSGLVVAWEFAGCDTTTAFDAGNAAAANGTPSLSLTTVANNCHILAIVQFNVDTLTAGTGYTLTNLTDSDFFNSAEQDTDFDAGTAGAKTVNFASGSDNYTLSALSLKPAAGGAAAIRLRFPPQISAMGVGGVLGGNRIN